jgi:hypothetical protein
MGKVFMATDETPAVILVTYMGEPGTRFDREYYEGHLNRVRQAMIGYGLVSAVAFYPAEGGAEKTLMMTELRFRDQASLEASLVAPEAAELGAEIPIFTDAKPARLRVAGL